MYVHNQTEVMLIDTHTYNPGFFLVAGFISVLFTELFFSKCICV